MTVKARAGVLGGLLDPRIMAAKREAERRLREGIEAKRIDRVARGFGMPMGPIELYDMIGLDTAFYAGLVLSAAYGDRIEASPVIPALVKAGRLGRKSGGGFYAYARGGQGARIAGTDAAVAEIIAFLSGSNTLPPGTVILTGTPHGVGMAAKPPRWLKAGDHVTIEIDRIGQLTNPVTLER
jgi:hypothetical protein